MSPGRRPGGRRLGALLAAAAVTAAVALAGCAGDDEPDRHTIAILRSVPAGATEDALYAGLATAGVPRKDLRVLGADHDEVHPDDAAEAVRGWVRQGAELIVALSTASAIAAAEATDRVPIVFLSNDPVGTGLVRNPRHPEANSTGVGFRVPADRTLALAQDALGDLRRIGCVYAADDPATGPTLEDLERGTAALAMNLHCAAFHAPDEAVGAVETVVAAGVDAIVLLSSPTTVRAFPQIERLVTGLSVPIITTTEADFAVFTLQPDGEAVYRQLAAQAARLLEGVDVADVPVEDPGHYQLVVNLVVARRIGRTIAPEIVERADEVVR